MGERGHRATVRAVAMYVYHTSAVTAARDLFPGRHPDYLAEKADAFMRSFGRFYGSLDGENQTKLADLIEERYGPAARARERRKTP
jgi:hypothetical protein